MANIISGLQSEEDPILNDAPSSWTCQENYKILFLVTSEKQSNGDFQSPVSYRQISLVWRIVSNIETASTI